MVFYLLTRTQNLKIAYASRPIQGFNQNLKVGFRVSNSSPAHSSASTTAIVGGGRGGGGSNSTLSVDDFYFPCDPLSTYERKDEALLVLKKDLMATLDKEVKSLDDDNWKFEGPRSRIHLVSSGGD